MKQLHRPRQLCTHPVYTDNKTSDAALNRDKYTASIRVFISLVGRHISLVKSSAPKMPKVHFGKVAQIAVNATSA